MKKKNVLIGVLVVLLMVALAAQSLAWWGDRGKAKKIEHIYKKLDLTEEQKEKFKALIEGQKEERKAEREKIKDLTKKMKEELQKDAPDRNKIHGYIKQMSEIRTKMQIKRIDSLLELRKTLTPEQREKFKKMLYQQKPPQGKRPPRKR